MTLASPCTEPSSNATQKDNGLVSSVVFSPDGNHLAVGSGGDAGDRAFGEAGLWDTRSFSKEASAAFGNVVTAIAFNASGKTVAVGTASRGSVAIWNPATKAVTTLWEGEQTVGALEFSPDGKSLAAGLWASTTQGGMTKVWNVATKGQVFALGGSDKQSVHSVTFSPDGKTLVTGTDTAVKCWDMQTGQERGRLKELKNGAWAVAFARNGRILATATSGSDRSVRIWDAVTLKELASFVAHQDMVRCLAFSPDSSLLATGSYDRTVKLWDVASHELRMTLRGHSDGVFAVAFSPNGKILATGSGDKTAKLWDLASGSELATLR
jgi:WD40 repeat protein